MVLELYLDLLSQPCRAIYIFAKKNNIPFQMHTVELRKGLSAGEHLSDAAFARVNPMKKVPAMMDGGFALCESKGNPEILQRQRLRLAHRLKDQKSVAILLYLAHKYKAPDHWYPQAPQARARVDEYLAWQHVGLRRSCLRALWHKELRNMELLKLNKMWLVEAVKEEPSRAGYSGGSLESQHLELRQEDGCGA
ncbi:Glutathione S-transferase theta-1 [Apodemus speciosus]|uniref:Glutathione S-transferase theta-1 n=1 Tax=Apodemus speciosus TaxID=105296 RepID=A0ABQ0F7N9_APOSI